MQDALASVSSAVGTVMASVASSGVYAYVLGNIAGCLPLRGMVLLSRNLFRGRDKWYKGIVPENVHVNEVGNMLFPSREG